MNAEFKRLAEKVLWAYANAPRLAAKGIWVLCADEMPELQVLERITATRYPAPGQAEHREFDYIRHGVVNVLVHFVLHSGHLDMYSFPHKNSTHYVWVLKRFRRHHRHLKGVILIHDEDGTHHSAETNAPQAEEPGFWRVRPVPVKASWMNQAKLVNRAFSRRYLKRGSWKSQEEFIAHVQASTEEYERLYEHPFEWTWTNATMRKWYELHKT